MLELLMVTQIEQTARGVFALDIISHPSPMVEMSIDSKVYACAVIPKLTAVRVTDVGIICKEEM